MDFPLLVEIAVRSALLFMASLFVVAAMRRRSAAERHMVLASALAVSLLLPVGFHALPEWAWKVWSVPAAQWKVMLASDSRSMPTFVPAGEVAVQRRTSAPHPIDSMDVIPAVLLAGMFVQLAWLGAGAWRVCRVRRRAIGKSLPVPTLESMPTRMPPVFLSSSTRVAFLAGIFRPVIVLPMDAQTWSSGRLRMVLSHELAHLQRKDHWFVLLCGLARVVYWWNPLAWLVLARLRRERECACDDMVIGQFRASDYASLLVDVARGAGAERRPAAQLAMATGSGIEGRVRAVLDESVSRSRPARGLVFGVLCGVATATVLLSTVRLVEAAQEVPSAGSVVPKPSGVTALARTGRQIEVQTKLIEVTVENATPETQAFEDALAKKDPMLQTEYQSLIRKIAQAKGVDLMSAPTVTAKPGSPLRINVTREFRYPVRFQKGAGGKLEPSEFDKRDIGIELEFQPMLNKERIILAGSVKSTKLQGFTESEPGMRMPVFNVNETRLVRELGDGETVGMWMPWLLSDEQTDSASDPLTGTAVTKKQIQRRLAVFVSVRLVDVPETAAAPAPTPKQAASPHPEKLAYATPVAGRPGYVTSPFAPNDGEVDVRGYPSNTEVKCPYTGKIFLVP